MAVRTGTQPTTEMRRRRGTVSDPAHQSYVLLRIAFVVAPILFGADKFFNYMTYWPKYLWSGVPGLLGLSGYSPEQLMFSAGVIEIVLGILVLLWPRVGSWLVSLWLAGVIANLVLLSLGAQGGATVYWDIALRDFGLLLAALALARLSAVYARRQSREAVWAAPQTGTQADAGMRQPPLVP